MAFDFEVEWQGDVLRVAGELDMAVAERFEATALSGSDRTDIVVDLGELVFIDSSGIRSLLRVAQAVSPRCVRLRSPAPSVRRVLDITGISRAAPNVTIEARRADG